MDHSETEIRIIGGYEGLEYTVDGGRKAQIPSQKLLQELVRFPKIDRRYPDPSDPFNVDRYRIRDREEDLENQLLLRSRSNWIIEKIDNQRFHLSEYENVMMLFCEEYGLCFQSIHYRLKLMSYCRNILPGGNINTYKNSKLIDAFSRLSPSIDNLGDRTYDLEKPLIKNDKNLDSSIAYQKKQVLFWESIGRRFSEFNEAFNYMNWFSAHPLYYEHFKNVHYEDILIQNTNNERIRKQRTRNRSGASTNQNSNDRIPDSQKIFTQCVFCNRFHFQEPTRSLRRFCDRFKCKLKNKAWVESLKPSRKNIDIFDVSPSGF